MPENIRKIGADKPGSHKNMPNLQKNVKITLIHAK